MRGGVEKGFHLHGAEGGGGEARVGGYRIVGAGAQIKAFLRGE